MFFIANLVVFSLLLFCGVNVPLDTLPNWMEAVGRALPLTHGIEAAREIAAGATLGDVSVLVWTELAIGVAYATVGVRALPDLRDRGQATRDARDDLASGTCAETSRRSSTSSRPRRRTRFARPSLQYVRKISGFTKPSQANEQAFERAVDEVTEASMRLLGELVTHGARRRTARSRRHGAARGPRSASPLPDLNGSFDGEIVRPGDPGYDAARVVWNGHRSTGARR